MVAVGRLFRAWGNRGELGGEIYSSNPGRAEKLKEVVLELADGKTRSSRIERIWWHDGRPVFKFEGIDSISDAEHWENSDVLVADSEREQPEEGSFSHADLIGCGLWNRNERRTDASERIVWSKRSALMIRFLNSAFCPQIFFCNSHAFTVT